MIRYDFGKKRRVALFNDTRVDCHFGCDLVFHELLCRLSNAGCFVVRIYAAGSDWREDSELCSGQLGVDLLIVNGEGTIHHSAARKKARLLAEVGTLGKSLGVPAILINSTVADIDEKTAAHLEAFTAVYVRESFSLWELRRMGVQAQVVPDLTLAAEFKRGRERHGVCGTDSVLQSASNALAARCEVEG